MMRQPLFKAWSTVLLAVCLLSLAACGQPSPKVNIQAEDLMENLSANSITGKSPNTDFVADTAEFSISLFKETFTNSQNTLLSPFSVLQALAMTANGADNQTLVQMESLLGQRLSMDELNEYLHTYTQGLLSSTDGALHIANSIWLNDDEKALQVEPDFLQKNADYYQAAAYRAAFDEQTVSDINQWVAANTDGLIKQMVAELNPGDVMVLLNAIALQAEWETPYQSISVRDDIFTAADGSKLTLPMMHSAESRYINDRQAVGFIKPYVNEPFSFVALLPNEDVGIVEYIAAMTGDSWLRTIGLAQSASVRATLPKFKDEYTSSLNETLKQLGMPDAFSVKEADFTRLGTSPLGNLFIGNVLHKTYMAVDELGTKAGAATAVEMRGGSAPSQLSVKLDRPFVYAIVDHQTNLPIFIGAMLGL